MFGSTITNGAFPGKQRLGVDLAATELKPFLGRWGYCLHVEPGEPMAHRPLVDSQCLLLVHVCLHSM